MTTNSISQTRRERFFRSSEAGLALVILLGALIFGLAVWQSRLSGQALEPPRRFEAVEVYVDTGAQALAAFQIELRDPSGAARIAGVEGGEHAAFKEPPYYDPAALRQERIVLAGFSTAKDLPVGSTRVARLHFEVRGGAKPDFATEVTVAAASDGARIPATIRLENRG
jgi:hypothetical protein